MKFHTGRKTEAVLHAHKKFNSKFYETIRPSFPCHVDVRKRVLNHNNAFTALFVEEDDAVVYSYD